LPKLTIRKHKLLGIDEILKNYGNALEVDYDLTNMSNMVMSNASHSATMMMMMGDSMKNSSIIREKSDNNMTNNIIVNLADYQTAQALSDKAQQIFNKDLKPLAATTSNVTTFIVKLENDLTQLRDAVNNNAAPMDVMKIVHTQIHPNLQKAYNLQLVS
jgi:septal ring factor EnvC (AmiA/AmiB activator)